MQTSTRDHTPSDHYRLLINLAVPRPIAWVRSVSGEGLVNSAPFSFFNAFAPIGRLGSPSMNSRATDCFALPRISYTDWQKKN